MTHCELAAFIIKCAFICSMIQCIFFNDSKFRTSEIPINFNNNF